MAQTIAIISLKGGVGKTTTAVNLGASLAALKYRTLIVGHDPQDGLCSAFGMNPRKLPKGLLNFYVDGIQPKKLLFPTVLRDLYVIPCNVKNSKEEQLLNRLAAADFRRFAQLRQELEEFFHFILIDCPPSLGAMTGVCLSASDTFIVPLQMDAFSLNNIPRLLETTRRVQTRYNEHLRLEGFLATMYDRNSKYDQQYLHDSRLHLKDRMFRTVIPRHEHLARSAQLQKPVLLIDWRAPGAQSYLRLAKELLERPAARKSSTPEARGPKSSSSPAEAR